MPSSQPQCSGRQGKRWACWFCCGCPWISLSSWTPWMGSWTGLLSPLPPGTSNEPACGCLLIPRIQGQLPGYNWNHCGNGYKSSWFKKPKLMELFLFAVSTEMRIASPMSLILHPYQTELGNWLQKEKWKCCQGCHKPDRQK